MVGIILFFPFRAIVFEFGEFLVHASRDHAFRPDAQGEQWEEGDVGRVKIVLHGRAIGLAIFLDKKEFLGMSPVFFSVGLSRTQDPFRVPYLHLEYHFVGEKGKDGPVAVGDLELRAHPFALVTDEPQVVVIGVVSCEVGQVGKHGPDHEW